MKKYEYKLINQISELDRLAGIIENLSAEFQLNDKTTYSINLALDELVTNIISYGYEDTKEHIITIIFEYDDSALNITLIDDGKSFNPLNQPPPKTDIPLEERKIGGFGIHFVKKTMDAVSYERNNGNNILTITKKITEGD